MHFLYEMRLMISPQVPCTAFALHLLAQDGLDVEQPEAHGGPRPWRPTVHKVVRCGPMWFCTNASEILTGPIGCQCPVKILLLASGNRGEQGLSQLPEPAILYKTQRAFKTLPWSFRTLSNQHGPFV
eukprot:s1365_g9.t1